MKKIIVLSLAMLFLTGCYANVQFQKTSLNGSKVSGSYTRWWNQNVENFRLSVDPNGTVKVSFDKQLSETEMAYNMGLFQGRVGGGSSK